MHHGSYAVANRWIGRNHRTKQGYPTRQSWQVHKAKILSLWLSDDKAMTLEDIVEEMRVNHGFSATLAMYKSRLGKWKAYRNKKRSSNLGTSVYHPVKTVTSRSSSLDELATIHPYSRQRYSGVSGDASDGARSAFSGTLLDRPSSVDSDDPSTESSELADDFTPCGSDGSTPALDSGSNEHGCPDLTSRPRSEPAPVALATPAIWDQMQHHPKHSQQSLLDAKISLVLKKPLDSPEPYERCLEIPRMQEIRADPRTFVNLAIRYCNLTSERMYDQADATASEAGQVYARILWQQHDHALTSLNTVLIMLLLYGRNTEAFEIVRRAREAATSIFHETHPIMPIIEYFMLQAANRYETTHVSQLTEGYDFFCNTLGPEHPYTLVAGYLLAWRNAANITNPMSMLHAAQLLCKLQMIADVRPGRNHLLSIAILNTKARVEHTLKLLPEAIANMEDVISRMRATHDDNHPYLLDARLRYGLMLFAVKRDDEAEREYISCALGQAALFGVEARATQNSLRRIEIFFITTQRTASAADFHNELAAASASHPSPTPGTISLKVAL